MYPNNKGIYSYKRRTSQNKKRGTYPNKKRTFQKNDGTSSNKNSTYRYKIREADIKNAEILVEVSCYPMTREKFEKLIRSSSFLDDWTINILFIGVGFAIKILTVWGIFIFNGYSDDLWREL